MLNTALAHATIPVVDLDRAKKFYLETLGLTAGPEDMGGIVVTAGQNSALYLYKRGQSKADHTLASFKVDNIEQEVAGLKDQGVVFEEYTDGPIKTTNSIATMGSAKAAWFKDSEGNILGLVQM